jgi:hypothetical protein
VEGLLTIARGDHNKAVNVGYRSKFWKVEIDCIDPRAAPRGRYRGAARVARGCPVLVISAISLTRRLTVANRQEPGARRRIFQIMASPARHVEQLERVLLRRGVGTLEADRHRCADCGRTPLTGEHVHLYRRAQGIVCELCRPLRREPPVTTEIVRHSEHGHAVRLTVRAA